MGSLDDLPPDQRAVLQMVLQRGRTYDEIAAALSIDRAAVRQRALDGCDALTPDTVVPGPERTLVTDYLLSQLPDQVADQVHAYLATADADRAWAAAIAHRLTPLASRPLPEVPVGVPLHADGPDVAAADTKPERFEDDAPAPERTPPRTRPPKPEAGAPASSRRGGAVLLGLICLAVVAAVVIVIVNSGGSSKPASTSGATKPARTYTYASTDTTAGTTATTTTEPTILAALNLTSPTGATATVGLAQVIREAGVVGIVIDAQGVPANGTHNAYGVWLYNGPGSSEFVGFVPNLVGKDGKLETEGKLPANAAHFHQLLITLETHQHPTTPGKVVLSGPFKESA